LNKRNNIVDIFVATGLFLLLLITDVNIWTSIGIGLSGFFFTRFFINIGNTVDFRDFIIIIPFLQWIVGPFLSYRFVSDETYYFMVVEEPVYMSFAVPALFLFAVGLYLPVYKKKIDFNQIIIRIQEKVFENKNIDLILIISGIIFYLLKDYSPPQLKFFVFLLGNLRYVGLFFLLLGNRKGKNVIFYSIVFFTILMSLADAMFHLMIIWFVFLFIIVSIINKFSLLKKTIIVLGLFAGLVLIQTVKHEYRKILYSGKASSTIGAFGGIVSEKAEAEGAFTSEANINNMVSRINQGWIIAKIMYYVPAFEPYANGETIEDAISAALLPRFLNPNKAISGGREYFMRFTGRNLEKGTSMNISILGEAYANYGKQGIWFMLVFGFFLNITYAMILKQIIKTPTLLFFLPIIYLQVIKAETDFATVLNHFIKASIFVWMVYFGLRKFLNIKI
jgi:hypothetical protein